MGSLQVGVSGTQNTAKGTSSGRILRFHLLCQLLSMRYFDAIIHIVAATMLAF